MSETPAQQAEPPKRAASVPNILVRFATAGVGIPIILGLLFEAPRYWFALVAAVVGLVGGGELAAMVLRGQRGLQTWLVLATGITASVLVIATRADVLLTLFFGVILVGAVATLLRPGPLDRADRAMGWLIAGPLYIGGGLAAVAKLHQLEGGGTWVVLSMMLAWGSDTGAYFAGRAFGRRKLYPKVSPKKTVEGALGGLAAAVAMAIGVHFAWLPTLTVPHAVALAVIAGAVGQSGDLCISLIKRATGVKDSGFIIPGHGGLLDRIDALLFTAPITLLYAHWILGESSSPLTLADWWF